MTDRTIDVPLTTSQILFLMDMMMGCNLGTTKIHAMQNNVDDATTYDQLANCLQNAHSTP